MLTFVIKSQRKGGYLKAETKSASVLVQRSEHGFGASGSRGGALGSGCHHRSRVGGRSPSPTSPMGNVGNNATAMEIM